MTLRNRYRDNLKVAPEILSYSVNPSPRTYSCVTIQSRCYSIKPLACTNITDGRPVEVSYYSPGPVLQHVHPPESRSYCASIRLENSQRPAANPCDAVRLSSVMGRASARATAQSSSRSGVAMG